MDWGVPAAFPRKTRTRAAEFAARIFTKHWDPAPGGGEHRIVARSFSILAAMGVANFLIVNALFPLARPYSHRRATVESRRLDALCLDLFRRKPGQWDPNAFTGGPAKIFRRDLFPENASTNFVTERFPAHHHHRRGSNRLARVSPADLLWVASASVFKWIMADAEFLQYNEPLSALAPLSSRQHITFSPALNAFSRRNSFSSSAMMKVIYGKRYCYPNPVTMAEILPMLRNVLLLAWIYDILQKTVVFIFLGARFGPRKRNGITTKLVSTGTGLIARRHDDGLRPPCVSSMLQLYL